MLSHLKRCQSYYLANHRQNQQKYDYLIRAIEKLELNFHHCHEDQQDHDAEIRNVQYKGEA